MRSVKWKPWNAGEDAASWASCFPRSSSQAGGPSAGGAASDEAAACASLLGLQEVSALAERRETAATRVWRRRERITSSVGGNTSPFTTREPTPSAGLPNGGNSPNHTPQLRGNSMR